ncbi:Putative Phage derived protein Gp49-like (DUF891) [Candidatus Glomeribacter gigasporarum BEG34]|uniref:Putative Phage derived protein Gp49-like (DUF891) n=1 Tax=Candidatus Glomeribacter gigasporarum BEG34 TaxID=1070319 RepID=G2JAQ1_9BURK|nr:Putative Phage derived protein Gp49-like (DUF891) [Candidatus Glomeribacter gigasporarum BEG34]
MSLQNKASPNAIFIRQQALDDWFNTLKDRRAKHRIQARIDRLQMGNPGDAKSVSGGMSELRIDYGLPYVHHSMRSRAGRSAMWRQQIHATG